MTVSTADRIATRGVSIPIARARSIAFCTMSRLHEQSGEMFTAASVISSGRV